MTPILPYKNPALPVEERVSDLIGRMNLEEKIGQVTQVYIHRDPTNINNVADTQGFNPLIGSVLGPQGGVANRNKLQREAVEKSRLGIPVIWGHDIIHGCKTLFQSPLGQACAWNPDAIEKSSRIAAVESRYVGGYDWTFSPMLDVPHDPRWGRVMEGYGEDPWYAGVCGCAAVRGYQTDDPSRPDAIAACLKHFVGYAASEGGRDYEYTNISNRMLHETYLVPFHACVDAGVLTLMSSFNDINGIPAVANHYTLTEVLRNKWGFKGFVVSDWFAVGQLEFQGYAADHADQAVKAITAGNDMDMISDRYKELAQLIKDGKFDEKILDQAVARILYVKFRLGLFENPYVEEKAPETVSMLPESMELARKIARESAVLLKNENNILPLSRDIDSIALIGPAAADSEAIAGAWSGDVDYETIPDFRQVISSYFPKAKINYVKGCEFKDGESEITEAVKAAEKSSVVLMFLGEKRGESGENASYSNIALTGDQEVLLEEVAGTGKPVILMVCTGRPTIYPEIEKNAKAILHLWQGGHGAAKGAFDVITGEWNPSGRLAITFPRSVGQIPVYYNQHHRARPGDQGAYHDLEDYPMYNFGYGLSYTTYEYSGLTMDSSLKASVTVKNTGSRFGVETVFLYLSDPVASLTQPEKRLIAFQRVELAAGESKTVSFQLNPMEHFAFINENGKKVLESGKLILRDSKDNTFEFNFLAGSNTVDFVK